MLWTEMQDFLTEAGLPFESSLHLTSFVGILRLFEDQTNDSWLVVTVCLWGWSVVPNGAIEINGLFGEELALGYCPTHPVHA